MPLDAETSRRFSSTIDKYKQKLKNSFAKIDHRIALQQILRVYDFNNLHEGTIDDSILSQQVWGLDQALLLFWNDDTRQAGLPLFRSEPLKVWGNFMLAACGRVRLIDQYLEQLNRGLLQVHVSSDSYLELMPIHEGAGVEVLQAEELNSVYADRSNLAHETNSLLDSREDIVSEMKTLVRPSQEYFIGYDTTPTIDDWYAQLAKTLAPKRLGWDCFPAQATFGGLAFSAYLECVETLMAFALKHIDFCDILCAKQPTIDPMDIYAFPSLWTDAVRYASYALNCSEETTSQLINVTRVTPDTAPEVLSTPASAPAPHYMFSSDLVMRSIKGCLDQPFVFLLKGLRSRYASDWDGAVDDRERLFRRDIADAFSVHPRLIFLSRNISITTSLGKTDIDLLAYDPGTSVVGLFQLKWQDLFAHSMRERESKKRNFLKESNEWVHKVCCWLDETKLSSTFRSCGVPKSVAEQISDVKVFVIGRNFSHFSGEPQKDLRAAWGSWARLCIVLKENPNMDCPLSFVFDSFQNDSPFSRFTLESKPIRLEIEGLTVVLRSK